MNFLTKASKFVTTSGRKALSLGKKYLPQICAGLSAGGAVVTTYLAVKTTVNAVRKVDAKAEELSVDKLETKEIIKTVGTDYIPVAVSLAATVTFGFMGCVSSTRRIAALTTTLKAVETARQEYREATREVVGKAKTEEIDSKAAQKRMEREPSDIVTYAEQTRYGNTLFRDSVTGRYFRSSIPAVKDQINEYNQELLNYDSLDLNDLYYKYEIDADTEVGKYLGWNASRGIVKYYFTDTHHPVTGEPCLQINYDDLPYYNFERMRY